MTRLLARELPLSLRHGSDTLAMERRERMIHLLPRELPLSLCSRNDTLVMCDAAA